MMVGCLALVAGFLAPFFYVEHKRKQRQEIFLRQLPNAFELMARVIRTGQSVPQALQAVVEAFEDPLSSEFGQCQTHLGLGLRPEVTFREMAHRCGLVEMRIFVMALLILQQTGGNLSDVLDRLAGMTRARLKLRNHVKTLTAEGRLQGGTLVVLPFVVFAAMMSVNRQYAETLLESTSLLVASGIGLLTGILWIRRIVNFDY
jgi:tight adherence protein B